MSDPLQAKFTRVVILIAAIIVVADAIHAQDNPYRLTEGWAQLPSGMKFGGVISTDVDARGNIWLVSSHTHFRPQGYTGPEHDEVLVFDREGKNRKRVDTESHAGSRSPLSIHLI